MASRTCYFCMIDFETRSPGSKKDGVKVWVCPSCTHLDKECAKCGTVFKAKRLIYDRGKYCSKECSVSSFLEKGRTEESAAKRNETMRRNGTGFFDPEQQRKNSLAAHEKQRINGTGKFDPENIRRFTERGRQVQKERGIGIFDPEKAREMQRISNEVQKERGIGIHDRSRANERAQKISETMRRNGTGFFDSENARRCSLIAHKRMKEQGTWLYNQDLVKEMVQNKLGGWSPQAVKLRTENRLASIQGLLSGIKSQGFRIVIGESEDRVSYFDGRLNQVPGVWAVFAVVDGKEVCLDVAETQDIGKEIRLFFRKLEAKRIQKYKEMSEFEGSIFFKLIERDVPDRKRRELIEMIYAVENHSRFWNMSPTQIKYLSGFDLEKVKQELHELSLLR